MSVVSNFLMQTATEPGSTSELNGLVLRAFIFLVVLGIFVFMCGLAWRTIPALRNIASVQPPEQPQQPQPKEELFFEAEEKEVAPEESPLTFAKPVTLSEAEEKVIAPVQSKPNPRPLPAEFLHDYQARGEAGAVYNDLEAAIADGRPGSVVKAASDLNGVATNSPIIIVKREE